MTAAGRLVGASLTTDGVRRLEPTTVDVRAGAVTAVLGRNGSGKSSLVGILAGELAPDEGSVVIGGSDIATLSSRELARRRALLSQERHVSFGFTVEEVVSWGRTPWRGTPSAQQDAAVVDEAIRRQDLDHLRGRPVTTLSGGERTRVHVARVLAQQAPLLLLDEADSDLDLVGRHALDEVVRAHATAGGAAVVVTHDVARIEHTCDDVVLMRDGAVFAHGPRREVMDASTLRAAFGIDVPWGGRG